MTFAEAGLTIAGGLIVLSIGDSILGAMAFAQSTRATRFDLERQPTQTRVDIPAHLDLHLRQLEFYDLIAARVRTSHGQRVRVTDTTGERPVLEKLEAAERDAGIEHVRVSEIVRVIRR
jgi:hypothetical protein